MVKKIKRKTFICICVCVCVCVCVFLYWKVEWNVYVVTPGLSEDIQYHERHVTLLTTCRSPNQTQVTRAVSLMIVDDHLDISTRVKFQWWCIWQCLISDCGLPWGIKWTDTTYHSLSMQQNEHGGWVKIANWFRLSLKSPGGWSQLREWQYNKQLLLLFMYVF